MKTSRIFRIFMMALDLIAMSVLKLFRHFSHLRNFPIGEQGGVPHAVASTEPAAHGIESELEVDGQRKESYTRARPVFAGEGSEYAGYDGVVTFRGDNFRSGAAFGSAEIVKRKLHIKWSMSTGRLEKGYGSGYWTGSGWTGQPLLVRWRPEEKAPMNIFEDKKAKEDLVEVIYSTMDGNVYFIDARDGTATREVLRVGLPFKGAGALHPSLPLLHLGPGDSGPREEEYARAYLYSMVDSSKLLEYGGRDSFAPRAFHGFDSSPLFLSDYLFEPAENGILYTFKLNSKTEENGRLSIEPSEFVKFRYKTARSGEKAYWLGMEDSAVLWRNYLYIADNGGTLLCIDVNTMRIVWAQDVADDTNGSPVFSMEDGLPYLYIGTSLHWKASRGLKLADVPIYKINALTGEYVWIRTYFCSTVAGISGGVQSTCALGKEGISDLVIFSLARTPSVRKGLLVALDKKTGKEVWRRKLPGYAWSSPVAVYGKDGSAYLVQGDSSGLLHLIDAATGSLLDEISLRSNIEASPAVFENMVVVGTRGMKIYGVEIV